MRCRTSGSLRCMRRMVRAPTTRIVTIIQMRDPADPRRAPTHVKWRRMALDTSDPPDLDDGLTSCASAGCRASTRRRRRHHDRDRDNRRRHLGALDVGSSTSPLISRSLASMSARVTSPGTSGSAGFALMLRSVRLSASASSLRRRAAKYEIAARISEERDHDEVRDPRDQSRRRCRRSRSGARGRPLIARKKHPDAEQDAHPRARTRRIGPSPLSGTIVSCFEVRDDEVLQLADRLLRDVGHPAPSARSPLDQIDRPAGVRVSPPPRRRQHLGMLAPGSCGCPGEDVRAQARPRRVPEPPGTRR